MSLAKVVGELERGLQVGPARIVATDVRDARVGRKEVLQIGLEGPKGEQRLLHATVFHGLAPYYHPWIEVMGVDPDLTALGPDETFAGSDVEARLAELFAQALPPGGRLYWGYEHDLVTLRELGSSVPPPISRTGYLLFHQGLTWYKDWYYPEGGSEGGMKLQAERALDADALARHHASIHTDVQAFLDQTADADPGTFPRIDLVACRERARYILDHLTA